MKVLFNKIKKANKIFLTIYLITFILYLVNFVFLTLNLLSLSKIETVIRILILVIFGIWGIVYLIWNLVNLILKKHITIAITTAVSIIFVVVFGIVNYYINMLNSNLDNLAEKEYVTYTSNLVVLKGTEINSDSILGMINNSEDIEGNVLAKELIKEHGLDKNEIKDYSSYYEMLYDLLNKEIDGVFLNSNYLTMFSDDEFAGLKNSEIVYSFSKKMKNKDTKIVSNKSLTEPFTILLMGVDSTQDGIDASTSFNGDTLMLITFNPKTLNATMFSIPRDTYVPIACNNNHYAKINSSAAYGTSCVINTIKQLTDIDIDYYVKINFKGVVDLVEALGGVEVDVEAPDYSVYAEAHNGQICEQNSHRQRGDKTICFDPGKQVLNGEQALAYARCRHAYLLSDIARNKHQQQIIEAIATKAARPENIGNLDKILNAITNNIETNMAKEQMLSFYDVLKDMIAKTFEDGEFLSIEKTYLEYYNLPVRVSNNGMMLSAIGYYPDSLEAIVNLMKANLGLEEKEMIKTFSFDANENYENRVTGQGITTGERLQTVPNFVGKEVSKAQEWARSNNIKLDIKFVDSDDGNYNSEVKAGMIANQSVSNGVLINNVTEITIYINNENSKDNKKPNDKDTTNNNTTKPNDNNTSSNNGDNANNKDDNTSTGNGNTTEPDNGLEPPLTDILPSEKEDNTDDAKDEEGNETP